MQKQLYILAGCNGAGKTTASLTILPEIWQCREFVNADAIACGLSPYDPDSVAIQAGRLMLQRINIPEDVIRRRYERGMRNFFELFKDQVDFWTLVDNTMNPRVVVADSNQIYDNEQFLNIQAYVKGGITAV